MEKLLQSDSNHIESVQKQLVEQESKVAHLTALLSETEKDLIKHIQMNNLLKEEIRRHQRSVEREKHAENLEYLKNVVVKVSCHFSYVLCFICAPTSIIVIIFKFFQQLPFLTYLGI